MACLNACPYCTGYKRCGAYSCDECNGENTRKSIRERTRNLGACLRDAAIEEMRVRCAVDRVRDTWSMP